MTILVGFIPTPQGWAAVDQAIAEALRRDAELVVVNTSRGDSHVDERYAQDVDVARLRTRLEAAAVEHRIVQAIRGRDAAEEILDAVDEHKADLVVIGLRRRTTLGKLILGSTAQRILLEAPCPVVAVKAE
jgi:nucleotide-binding universal stress UspA family protein